MKLCVQALWMSQLRTMRAVVNGAVLGKPVVTPAFLDQTHAQNQKDVLVIDKQQPSPVSDPH